MKRCGKSQQPRLPMHGSCARATSAWDTHMPWCRYMCRMARSGRLATGKAAQHALWRHPCTAEAQRQTLRCFEPCASRPLGTQAPPPASSYAVRTSGADGRALPPGGFTAAGAAWKARPLIRSSAARAAARRAPVAKGAAQYSPMPLNDRSTSLSGLGIVDGLGGGALRKAARSRRTLKVEKSEYLCGGDQRQSSWRPPGHALGLAIVLVCWFETHDQPKSVCKTRTWRRSLAALLASSASISAASSVCLHPRLSTLLLHL